MLFHKYSSEFKYGMYKILLICKFPAGSNLLLMNFSFKVTRKMTDRSMVSSAKWREMEMAVAY